MSYIQASAGSTTLHSRIEQVSRPFGVDFAPQSRTYLMTLPLVLTISGLVTWVLPSNAMFIFAAFVGGVAGLYILFDIAFREAPLRLSLLLAMSLLIAYNLGALNSWLTVPRADLTLADYFTRDPAVLARAAGASLVAAALLLAVGQLYERPIFGREFFIAFDSRSVFLVCLSTALILFGYATGQIGYMGVSIDESGHTGAFAALIVWWSAPALAYSVCAFLNTRGLTRGLLGFCALVQALAIVPTGRRNFAFALLLSLIATRLGKFRSRLHITKKLLLGAGIGVLVVIASIVFIYLRVAGWGHKEATTLGSRVSIALDSLQTRNLSEITGILKENASTRTFDIGYFSDLLEASQHDTPLMGSDALHNFLLVIPSAISADKFGMEPYAEEQLVDMKWGFGYTDEANSLLTAGVADFGILGMFLYPLLAVLLLRILLEAIQFVMPTYAAVMMALAFISQMLLAEQTLAAYFGQVRDCLIFVVIVYVVSIFPKFRMKHPDHA